MCAAGLLLGFLSRNMLTDVVLPGATFSRLQQQVSRQCVPGQYAIPRWG
jgi:hypothetical protein